jgi:hypothetical protein
MSDREHEGQHPGRRDGADPGDQYYDPLSESLDSTADGGDPLVDRRLRGLIGPIAPMNAPVHGFDRVMMRVRRRRARAAALRAGGALMATAAVISCVFIGIRIGEGTTVPSAACGSSQTGDCATSGSSAAGLTRTGTASAQPSGAPGTAQPAATPTATASGGNGALHECTTTDLKAAVSVVANSQGAGNEELNIALTNQSSQQCAVYGYPGLKLEDMNQSQQATTVQRTTYAVQAVELVPNGGQAATTVRFDMDVPGTGDATSGPCQPETYFLEITPPNQTTQLVAEISGGPVTVCQNGTLQAYPFVAGSTGPGQ